jgi:hypothetical protein
MKAAAARPPRLFCHNESWNYPFFKEGSSMSDQAGWIPYDPDGAWESDIRQVAQDVYTTIQREFSDLSAPLNNDICRQMTNRSAEIVTTALKQGRLKKNCNFYWSYRPNEAHLPILYIK